MSAKTYHERTVAPLISKLKNVIRSIPLQFFDKTRELKTTLDRANCQIQGLSKRLKNYEAEMPLLREMEKDYRCLRRGLGDGVADRIINDVKTQEFAQQKQKRSVKRDYGR